MEVPEVLRQSLWPAAAVLLLIAAGLVLQRLLFAVLARAAKVSERRTDDRLVQRTRGPATLVLPLLATVLALPSLGLPQRLFQPLEHLLALGLIGGMAWLSIRLLTVLDEFVAEKYQLADKSDLHARRVRTQAQVFHRMGVVVVLVVTAAAMLMTFPSVRHVGVSLFASAGIAGIVAGIAARPTLSNLIAGMQVALTEPMRIDDIVVVDGEWGRIEEIGATYVVVCTWDQRRVVLPLTYFVEKAFANWTRTGTRLIGTAFVYADYTVPVEVVRGELKRILDATPLWDGKAWGLQVTDASEHSMQLRALMSAADSGKLWDLRCLVREALVDFLQKTYPQGLPKTRAELSRSP